MIFLKLWKQDVEQLKLEQGMKSMSNLVDSFVGRAKIYTDGTKKGIIELMDTRISEFDSKNMELFSKFYNIHQKLIFLALIPTLSI